MWASDPMTGVAFDDSWEPADSFGTGVLQHWLTKLTAEDKTEKKEKNKELKEEGKTKKRQEGERTVMQCKETETQEQLQKKSNQAIEMQKKSTKPVSKASYYTLYEKENQEKALQVIGKRPRKNVVYSEVSELI